MINLTGKTDESGSLFIHGKRLLDDLLKKNPSSTILLEVKVLPEGPSKQLIGYYEMVMLPAMKNAFVEKGVYLKLKKIDEMLRQSFSGTIEERIEDGVYIEELRPIRENSKETILVYLDFVRLYASNNLHIHLSEPRTL